MYSQIIVLGVGGTGGYLVEPLARFLSYESSGSLPKKLVLIDGDIVERKNLKRQRFSEQAISHNKAKVWAIRLQKEFENLEISSYNRYLTKQNALSMIPENSVVLSCVDNHATRKTLHDTTKRKSSILIISGGNEFVDGSVQIYKKENGNPITPELISYHPEIENPSDKNPAEMSCEELSVSSPQLIFTNLTAATLMLIALHRALRGAKDSEVYFDINKCTIRSVERPIIY